MEKIIVVHAPLCRSFAIRPETIYQIGKIGKIETIRVKVRFAVKQLARRFLSITRYENSCIILNKICRSCVKSNPEFSKRTT